MVWSPLSEVPQIGRMPIYILTIAVFIVLQVPIALSTNYDMLITFHFLTRLFGSPILATGGATIADLYAPKKRAYSMAHWGVFATCGPSLGPLLGGFATHFEGWRWTIWELLWLSAATFVLLFFFFIPRPPHPTYSTVVPAASARQPETPRSSQLPRSQWQPCHPRILQLTSSYAQSSLTFRSRSY